MDIWSKGGQISVNLPMKEVVSGMFKVQQEAQCGRDSVRRIVGDKIKEATRSQIRQSSVGLLF